MGEIRIYRADTAKRVQVFETIRTTLGEKPEILFAFLYGSFASELLFRDIDVAVFVNRDETDFCRSSTYESHLSMELEEALGGEFPVEIKVINDAPLSFCFQVIRGEVLFSNSEEDLTHFMTTVARRYLDMAPLRHHYLLEAMA